VLTAVHDPAVTFDSIQPQQVRDRTRDARLGLDSPAAEVVQPQSVPVHMVRLDREPYSTANALLFRTAGGSKGVLMFRLIPGTPQRLEVQWKLATASPRMTDLSGRRQGGLWPGRRVRAG
jgi:hypothetical protein